MFPKLRKTIAILIIVYRVGKTEAPVSVNGSQKDWNNTFNANLNLDSRLSTTDASKVDSTSTLDDITQLTDSVNGKEDWIDALNETDFYVTMNNSFENEEPRGPVEFNNGILSKAQYDNARRYISMIVRPAIALFGIVGNLLSLKCLLNHSSRDSVMIYLCALAITDTVGLLCVFVEWLPIVLREKHEHMANVFEAYIFIPVSVFLRLASFSSSSYIIVTMTVERLFAVLRPMRMKHNLFVRYPKAISSSIIIAVTSFFLLNIWRYEIHSFFDTETNLTTYSVKRSKAAEDFFNIYGLIGQILFTFSSTLIVLFCTAFIIVILFRQTKLRRKITSHQAVDPSMDMRRVTWMLVTIATVFSLSTLPTCTIGIISKFSNDIKLFSKEHYFVYLMFEIGNLLTAIRSSVNFLVYVVFSSRFRGDFISLITCSQRTVVKNVTQSSQIS